MSTITKKYRCRYFAEDGRPVNPTCNQGDSCRFVHPNDPQWPGLPPFIDTRLLKSSSAAKRNKADYSRTGGSHPSASSSEGRGPALVSQSDLFLRCKVEVDEQSVRNDRDRVIQKEWDSRIDRDRDIQRERERHRAGDTRDPSSNIDRAHKSYLRNRSTSPVRPYVKKYNRTGPDGSRKSELDNRNNKPSGDLTQNGLKGRSEGSNVAHKTEGSVDPKAFVSNDFASSAVQNQKPWIGPATGQTVPSKSSAISSGVVINPQLSEERKRAEKLVGLFRGLARLSNQVVQDTAAYEREGQKLQTYTEISSALSKISASVATSVAPTLAEIMLKHEQCKHRVEENFRTLGGVWEQVFDVFVTEVVHVIDAGLQDAMITLKKEGEHVAKEIVANAAGSLKPSIIGDSVAPHDRKRGRARGLAEKENEETRSGRGASRDREHKRRRFASHSSSPDSHDYRRLQGADSSIEDILTQMKMKIDQQAQSLQLLTKENSELKTTLKHTTVPATSSCSSFSVSSTSQHTKPPSPQSVDTTPTKPRLLALNQSQ
ncbi:hypothetical protein B0H10DRAFT_853349 [Mycena sp. CBHHK59/15]|nr:hypothetical protein B0H10DRAFT_853349 [Mycena sp. CBHHK59/15]